MALANDCLILIPFRLLQISCFTLRLTCFSSDSDNCPTLGTGPLFQFPHLPRAGLILLTLPFSPLVPLSYRVLCGSIYSFLLVRYSCPLSAGVLHAWIYLLLYVIFVSTVHNPNSSIAFSDSIPLPYLFLSIPFTWQGQWYLPHSQSSVNDC